jgi:hypothetical protein
MVSMTPYPRINSNGPLKPAPACPQQSDSWPDLVFDAILDELRLVTPSVGWRNDLVRQSVA